MPENSPPEIVRLRELEELKDTFVSLVSHELRTPLGIMIGYLDLGLEELNASAESGEAREFFEKARTKAKEVSRIVQELTDFARLQRGVEVNVDDPIPLQQVIAQVAELFKPKIEERNLQLVVTLPPEVAEQKYDGERLLIILRNLLSNAAKFSPTGQPIRLTGELVEARALMIAMSDYAPPIPKEKQELIFEDFRQLENYLTRRYEGLGLGLAVARRVARALGGDLILRVREDGNTFVLTLPLNSF